MEETKEAEPCVLTARGGSTGGSWSQEGPTGDDQSAEAQVECGNGESLEGSVYKSAIQCHGSTPRRPDPLAWGRV